MTSPYGPTDHGEPNPWSNTEFGDKALPAIGEGCDDCLTAAQVEHWDFTAGCKGCAGRSLGRIFLSKGEYGSRFKRACAQLGVTVDEAKAAHQADAMHKDGQR
jgi:hypothetical protein